jgi:hypothetical protein
MVLIDGADDRAAIQLEMRMWLRRGDETFFQGHVVGRRGGERSCKSRQFCSNILSKGSEY